MSDIKQIPDRVDLIKRMPKNAVCAEIGTQRGIFAEKIWELTTPRKMHLIDIWEPVEGLTELENHAENFDVVHDKFVSQIDLGSVKIHKGNSLDVLQEFPDSYFDWVYIDDDPRYEHTKKILKILKKKVKATGFICGHNYFDGDPKVFGTIPAVDEFCGTSEWYISYLTAPNNTPNDGYARFLSYILENKFPKVIEYFNPYADISEELFRETNYLPEIFEKLYPEKIALHNEDFHIQNCVEKYCFEYFNIEKKDDYKENFLLINDKNNVVNILNNAYSYCGDESIIILFNANFSKNLDLEYIIKQFPYIRYFSKDLCLITKSEKQFNLIINKFKEDLLVVCGNKKNYTIVKAVISSAIYSGLWQGDVLFVCDEYCPEIEKDLEDKNIYYLVINQEILKRSPIFNSKNLNLKYLSWQNYKLLKYIIFYFDSISKWEKVVFLDCDALVLDKIDFHNFGDFCATNNFNTLESNFEKSISKKIINDMELDCNKFFNSDVFSINTKIISNNIRRKLFEANLKYLKYSIMADQPILNYVFKNIATIIGKEYNCERDIVAYSTNESGDSEREKCAFNFDNKNFVILEKGKRKKYIHENISILNSEDKIVNTKIISSLGPQSKNWNKASHRFDTWKKYYNNFLNIFVIENKNKNNIKKSFYEDKKRLFYDSHYENYTIYKYREDLIKSFKKNGIGLEVGAGSGRFSRYLFNIIKPKEMYLVDCWKKQSGTGYELDGANNENHIKNYQLCCEEMMQESIDGRVSIIQEDILNVAESFPDNYFDWIYLDGNKSYNVMIKTLNLLDKKMKDDGVISGHDYFHSESMNYGVIEAIRDFCKNKGWFLSGLTDEEFPSFCLKRDNNFVSKNKKIIKEPKTQKISVIMPVVLDDLKDRSYIETGISSLLRNVKNLGEIIVGFGGPKESLDFFDTYKYIYYKYKSYGKIKFLFFDKESNKISSKKTISKKLFDEAKFDIVLFWDTNTILMDNFDIKYNTIKNDLSKTLFLFNTKRLERKDKFPINDRILDCYYHYYDNKTEGYETPKCFLVSKGIFNIIYKYYEDSVFFSSSYDSFSFVCDMLDIKVNRKIFNCMTQYRYIYSLEEREKESVYQNSKNLIMYNLSGEDNSSLSKFWDYDEWLNNER